MLSSLHNLVTQIVTLLTTLVTLVEQASNRAPTRPLSQWDLVSEREARRLAGFGGLPNPQWTKSAVYAMRQNCGGRNRWLLRDILESMTYARPDEVAKLQTPPGSVPGREVPCHASPRRRLPESEGSPSTGRARGPRASRRTSGTGSSDVAA